MYFDKIYVWFLVASCAYYCLGIAGDERKEKCSNEADPCHAFCDGAAALLARGLRGEEGQQHRQRPVDRYDRQRHGDGENTTRSVDRRNAAASASDRSRYFGSDKTITHENGNLYGKTYLNPETEKSTNAQLRSNGRSLTGITNDELYSYDLRYRQMLSNGRVHDTDGFLFDGENTHYNTLK